MGTENAGNARIFELFSNCFRACTHKYRVLLRVSKSYAVCQAACVPRNRSSDVSTPMAFSRHSLQAMAVKTLFKEARLDIVRSSLAKKFEQVSSYFSSSSYKLFDELE